MDFIRLYAKQRLLLRLFAGAAVVLLLQGCAGGCSRTETTPPEQSVKEDRQNREKILSQPVEFEPQSVEECLRMLEGGTALSHADVAQIIVVTEAAMEHLSVLLDNLADNDDDADTWNVLTELKAQPWVTQTMRIVALLPDRQLDAKEYERAMWLEQSANHVMTVSRRIVDRNGAFPVLFPND